MKYEYWNVKDKNTVYWSGQKKVYIACRTPLRMGWREREVVSLLRSSLILCKRFIIPLPQLSHIMQYSLFLSNRLLDILFAGEYASTNRESVQERVT